MNFSNPILVCDENEEFRILIRDMLTKNGFFHVVEAASEDEAKSFLGQRRDYFVLIDSKLAKGDVLREIKLQKEFIVFADKNDPGTVTLAANLGVVHLMNYPFHSRKLLEKINALL